MRPKTSYISVTDQFCGAGGSSLGATHAGCEMLNRIVCADALTYTRTLPNQSVNCVITSPPYFGLRDYGVDGQIGMEKSPTAFIARLIELFREIRRVLRDDGLMFINLGDSYNGSGKGHQGKNAQVRAFRGIPTNLYNMPPKSMILIPQRFAIAMSDDGWVIRSEIVWSKGNPMPESVTDRPTKAHEVIWMISKQPHYWSDMGAVKEPQSGNAHPRGKGTGQKLIPQHDGLIRNNASFNSALTKYTEVPGGRNARDVWTINSEASGTAHYATYPQELVRRCLLMGCPVSGVVYDPFIGSGTTAVIAAKTGRNFLGCDINPKYVELAQKRVAKIPAWQPDLFDRGEK